MAVAIIFPNFFLGALNFAGGVGGVLIFGIFPALILIKYAKGYGKRICGILLIIIFIYLMGFELLQEFWGSKHKTQCRTLEQCFSEYSHKEMTMKKKVIVLISGGMDSVCSLYDAAEKYSVILGISFNYGSKHNSREIPFAEYHCKKLGVNHITIDLDFMNKHFDSALLQSGGDIPDGHYQNSNMKQTVVPFRNGIMLSIAAGIAESKDAVGLVIAAHSGDHAIYPDCREDFLESISNTIRLGTYVDVEVIRPFVAMSKDEIAKRGDLLGIDFSKTWSCYKGMELHCGKCGTCVERKEAFHLAGLKDPTIYEK